MAVDWSGQRDGSEREAIWCAEAVGGKLRTLANGRCRSELTAAIIDTAKSDPPLVLGLYFGAT